jgi:Fe-S cluster assembly protein SufD
MSDRRELFAKQNLQYLKTEPFKFDYLNEFRKEAEQKLEDIPFPTKRDEEWKYLSLKDLAKKTFKQTDLNEITEDKLESYVFAEDTHYLVFVNGEYKKDLSNIGDLPEGAFVSTFREASKKQADEIETHLGKYAYPDEDLFLSLNSTAFNDGVFVYVPKDTKVEKPIHILNFTNELSSDTLTTSRVLVLGDRFSKFTVIEDFVGLGENSYLNIPVSEFVVSEGSHVKHMRIQRESLNAYNISRVGSHVESSAHYDSYTIHLGAKLSRSDVKAVIDGTNSDCTLDGLVLLNGEQVSDTHTVMHHKQPDCNSHQLHKVIVDGDAHSIFNGKIWVDKIAQKTDSFQENRNILLSDTGTINTKPQLEIFADDVKCSHGATIGQLDEDEMFYMKSRGLTDAKAKELLIQGYAWEVLENIDLKPLAEELQKAVAEYSAGVSKALAN